jgi:hypothetical protein
MLFAWASQVAGTIGNKWKNLNISQITNVDILRGFKKEESNSPFLKCGYAQWFPSKKDTMANRGTWQTSGRWSRSPFIGINRVGTMFPNTSLTMGKISVKS